MEEDKEDIYITSKNPSDNAINSSDWKLNLESSATENQKKQNFEEQEKSDSSQNNDTSMMEYLGSFLGCILSVRCCCYCFPSPYQEVEPGHVGLLYKHNEYVNCYVGPNKVKLNLITEEIIKVDIKTHVTEILGQTVITKDMKFYLIDSALHWRITNPRKATFDITDVRKALIELTKNELMKHFGSLNVDNSSKLNNNSPDKLIDFGNTKTKYISDYAQKWGVEIDFNLYNSLITIISRKA
ncbi:26500_t:CDS:2 [Dentiscutata erythropus]|uniref:26500_t:CDS:1 n=1 Tax=Dentiscutata erythropus TaxID=1348616 RepID=A0A9N8VAN4_9GLOM|nr:26500_t:CDS:2 [Dentiscutata erythropus]